MALNLLAMTKRKEFLQMFEVDPGYKLVYFDWSSIEPHCLAHYSQDPALMSIYGPDAAPGQCIYAHFGANTVAFGDKFRPIYEPGNPASGAAAKIKAKYPVLRSICKAAHLGLQYGAYAKRIYIELNLMGIEITMEEALMLWRDWHREFRGIRSLYRTLKAQWYQNGGYILNGRGRPRTVRQKKMRDLVNEFIQSTAHDYHVMAAAIVTRRLEAAGFPLGDNPYVRPWFPDHHDASALQVHPDYVDMACDIIRASVVELNDTLNLTVQLKAEPEVGTDYSICVEG